ncbi:MAG: bifunctional nicotinamide-nucleotide adenylyltransferase/Nudix hydroxylase [Candidatus Thiodiazotropha sp. (ex Monitilora ramsayi)]|nr:bifunctional nicotinamide-nucleotide adenylyltransferase/Nudix hydroxylase [Candidatus Thiodiazotropha sp. (ex Monitilora ramsayi)]
MSKPFDFLVFIGRFQPFHQGHLSVVQEGLREAERVIVLIGSAHRPRNIRDPWTVDERTEMLRSAVGEQDSERVIIAPLMDVLYNDELWVRNVQATVQGLVTAHHAARHREPTIGLIGHSKDHSSYYLKLFPRWGSVTAKSVEGLNATQIREALFSPDDAQAGMTYLDSQTGTAVIPKSVNLQLQRFVAGETYRNIREEQAFVADYKAGWANAPYAPTFVTVDAVVVQSGHVLLVTRKAFPGRGQLALPGGFIQPHEQLEEAMLRELREETRLKVPAPVLKGSIRRQQVFDSPYRSTRGRTITHAFYIELSPDTSLPKVKGGDDAKHAQWVPLASLDPRQMYEDHYDIIQEMVGM